MASEKRGLKAIGCGCCAGLLVVCVLAAWGLVVGAKAFASFGIATDLSDHIRSIEQADIDPETREQLLEQLERLRSRARRGEHVGFFSWLSYDESLEELIEDGPITDRDAAAFQRELDRIEEELDSVPDDERREPEPAAPGAPLVRAG